MVDTMDTTQLDDLVNQAEQLTAEFSGEASFPRVERNLRQLAEAGQQLWARTAQHAPRQTSDVRASVLLGTKGYDLQKVTQKLDSFSNARKATPVETITESDTQGFLKNERESAILSIVEEVKKSAFDAADKNYWDRLERDWEDEKLKILNALVGPGQDASEADISLDTVLKPKPVATSFTFSTPQDEANFVSHVFRLIREKKSVSNILGYISEDGCRIPGELDQHQTNCEPILEKIALECEKQGFFEEAIELNDLAYKHNQVILLLNRLLSSVVSEKPSPNSKRDRLEALSLKLAERYSIHGHRANKEVMATFFLLLDLMTFFSYYYKQAFNDALDTIEKLKVIPFKSSEIDLKVQEFSALTEEIRRNIPEMLLASMNILYAQYKETKTSASTPLNKFGITAESSFRDQRCAEIREKARTLITYSGMIPYRMPGNTNAKLVQLEVLMH